MKKFIAACALLLAAPLSAQAATLGFDDPVGDAKAPRHRELYNDVFEL